MSATNDERIGVLVIDDEPLHAEAVAESLERKGYACTIATSGKRGAELIDEEEFGIVLTDLRMNDVDGLAIVRKVREEHPETEVVVITGYGEVKTAVEAIRLGASHYLMKPVDLAELRAIVDRAAERRKLSRTNQELRRQLDEKFGFEGVVGNSRAMQKVLDKLKAYAPTQATVLITGENGTGKELAARALHTNSPRKNKPFVAMNCAALNENLLDDEMFGHEPHAFTGAEKLRKGRFEAAHGGTLFLDEVGDMPLALQAKLLRVLENGEITRIGSNDPIKVDVRLVTATNRDLDALIAEGKFRQDLFYRLKVGIVRLPALRERKEDIPLLIAQFMKDLGKRHGKEVSVLSEGVRKALLGYEWPGNVRELRNTIESMIVVDTDGVLGVDDLPEGDAFRIAGTSEPAGADSLIGRPLAEVERFYAERALSLTEGNREEAAKMLGIGERTLYRMIKDWKLLDQIKEALTEANGDLALAAQALDMEEAALEREIKRLGFADDSSMSG